MNVFGNSEAGPKSATFLECNKKKDIETLQVGLGPIISKLLPDVVAYKERFTASTGKSYFNLSFNMAHMANIKVRLRLHISFYYF